MTLMPDRRHFLEADGLRNVARRHVDGSRRGGGGHGRSGAQHFGHLDREVHHLSLAIAAREPHHIGCHRQTSYLSGEADQ